MPNRLLIRRCPADQRPSRIDRDVCREGQEAQSDDSERPAFRERTAACVGVDAQTPDCGQAGRDLNEAVDPESDEGDTASEEPLHRRRGDPQGCYNRGSPKSATGLGAQHGHGSWNQWRSSVKDSGSAHRQARMVAAWFDAVGPKRATLSWCRTPRDRGGTGRRLSPCTALGVAWGMGDMDITAAGAGAPLLQHGRRVTTRGSCCRPVRLRSPRVVHHLARGAEPGSSFPRPIRFHCGRPLVKAPSPFLLWSRVVQHTHWDYSVGSAPPCGGCTFLAVRGLSLDSWCSSRSLLLLPPTERVNGVVLEVLLRVLCLRPPHCSVIGRLSRPPSPVEVVLPDVLHGGAAVRTFAYYAGRDAYQGIVWLLLVAYPLGLLTWPLYLARRRPAFGLGVWPSVM